MISGGTEVNDITLALLLLILNRFANLSGVFIVDFERVETRWEIPKNLFEEFVNSIQLNYPNSLTSLYRNVKSPVLEITTQFSCSVPK